MPLTVASQPRATGFRSTLQGPKRTGRKPTIAWIARAISRPPCTSLSRLRPVFSASIGDLAGSASQGTGKHPRQEVWQHLSRCAPLKIQLNRPEESRAFLAASSLAFGMLIVLVLATPFVDMSGAVSPEQKVYRLYGYGLLGMLQVALIPVRGWQRSLRIVSAPAGLFIDGAPSVWRGASTSI